jgi:hypothetical protein
MGRALHRIPSLVAVAMVGLAACGGRTSLLDGEPLQSVCVQVAKMGNEVGCALFLQDGSSHDMCPPGSGSGVGGPALRALPESGP